jgi:hypothetical protein
MGDFSQKGFAETAVKVRRRFLPRASWESRHVARQAAADAIQHFLNLAHELGRPNVFAPVELKLVLH